MTSLTHSTLFADKIQEQLNDVKKYVSDCDRFLSKRACHLNSTNAKPLVMQAKNVAKEALQLYNSMLSLSSANADDSGISVETSMSFDDASINTTTDTAINTTAGVKQSGDYSISAILRRPDQSPCDASTSAVAASGSAKRNGKTAKIAQRVLNCEFCGKLFDVKWRYDTHRRTHTGEKPFVCMYAHCRKAFADCSNLRAHEKTHGEKVNMCQRCGKSFTLRSYYNKHRKSACERNQRRDTLRTLMDDCRRLEKQRPKPKLPNGAVGEIGDVGTGLAKESQAHPLRVPLTNWYVTPPNLSAFAAYHLTNSSPLSTAAIVASPTSSAVGSLPTLFSNQSVAGSCSSASLPNTGGQPPSLSNNSLPRDLMVSLRQPLVGDEFIRPSTSASVATSSAGTALPSMLNWSTVQLYLKYLTRERAA